jgi:hypothetical protein
VHVNLSIEGNKEEKTTASMNLESIQVVLIPENPEE